MAAFPFRLPDLNELKTTPPKQLAILHGEKVIVLGFLIFLLVSIIGLARDLAGTEDDPGKLEQDILAVEKKLRDPVAPKEPPDLLRELRSWEKPPLYGDAWGPDRAALTGERLVLVPQKTGSLIVRGIDAAKSIWLTPPFGTSGYGFILESAVADPADMNLHKTRGLPREMIKVHVQGVDAQWAVVYSSFDVREFIKQYALSLTPYWEALNPTGTGLRVTPALDSQQQPLGGSYEEPRVSIQFAGLAALRCDVTDRSGTGAYRPVNVTPPLGPDETYRVLPPPLDLPLGSPWPPERVNLWQGHPLNIAAIIRPDPIPVYAGRGSLPLIPNIFTPGPPPGVAHGGKMLSLEEPAFAGTVDDQMKRYVHAYVDLLRVEAERKSGVVVDPRALERRETLARNVTEVPFEIGVRFVDTSVASGRKYRYKLALQMHNPLSEFTYARQDIRDTAPRQTPWSEPSDVISIPRRTEFFVRSAQNPGGNRPVIVDADLHTLWRGVWRVIEIRRGPGERVAYSGTMTDFVFLADPVQKEPNGPGVPVRRVTDGPPFAPWPVRESFFATGDQSVKARVDIPVTFDAGALVLQVEPWAAWETVPTRAEAQVFVEVKPPFGRPGDMMPLLGRFGQKIFGPTWLEPPGFRPQPTVRPRVLCALDDGTAGWRLMNEAPKWAMDRRTEFQRWQSVERGLGPAVPEGGPVTP